MAKKLVTSNELANVDNIGKVLPRSLQQEMQESYLSYAMSVIVSRALPDVRDGLKPVHRRILYAMSELGLRHNAKHRKSATVVGEVLGKYHPHGDQAVYQTMVGMAQDFNMRYPLVDGQGNFGSLDGDEAAAHRYTEARMTALAEELLVDIDKDTVAWRDNYDATRQEPVVLPGKLPNLLLNGTLGIAVGMATDIPPHNLREIVDAIVMLIENPDSTMEDIMNVVQGPDFPTGGLIFDTQAIKNAYSVGKGGIVVRGKADIEETKSGYYSIIISEVPYRTNKATFLEKIADLVRDKKIEDIKDVRDESDKDGVRVVIELKKDALANKILNQLYSYTQLQTTFHLNMLGLSEGIEPKVMNLKSILSEYIAHRQVVVRKRTEYDLRKAKEREHILEGLKIALDFIDEVIKTIRKSPTKEEAKINLIKRFKLTEIQAQAILDMRLQTLAGLERQKIEEELKEKKKLIAELESILKSEKKILGIVKTESLEMREKYGDERRTKVIKNPVGSFSVEDLIPDEEVIITTTKSGYIKRMSPDSYRAQVRGGKGVIGQTLKEEDIVDNLLTAKTLDDILFFTNKGRAFLTKVYEIPESSRVAKGQALVNFLQLGSGEVATAVLTLSKNDPAQYIVMTTVAGVVKKVDREEFTKVRKSGIIAIGLKGDDELRWVRTTTGKDEIMMTSELGQAVRFKETDVRAMGRTASGVTGMRLKKGDKVISTDVIRSTEPVKELEVLVITENGLGKKSPLTDYRITKRGSSGVKTLKVTPKTGKAVSMYIVNPSKEGDLIIISKRGQTIRTNMTGVPSHNRSTQGVRIMRLDEGDLVAASSIVLN